jgi:branched-chain amino acid transport system ATP-binding protein
MTLKILNLSAGYGRFPVLKNLTLEAKQGEIVALLGANGAGKTTLLRAISGLATVREGSISLFGANTTYWPAVRLVLAGLIHVPQGRKLFGEMSVRENLEMGAYLTSSRQTFAERMEQVYAMFPILRERSKQPAAVLSGGEQQMLAIGRALMAGPRFLLMDEPSLGLAPKTFDLILAVAKRINAAGTGILIAEQNAAKVLRLAHRAYVIENGRISAEGHGESLLLSGQIRASYLGAA